MRTDILRYLNQPQWEGGDTEDSDAAVGGGGGVDIQVLESVTLSELAKLILQLGT
jgi:hypothetical protein